MGFSTNLKTLWIKNDEITNVTINMYKNNYFQNRLLPKVFSIFITVKFFCGQKTKLQMYLKSIFMIDPYI